MVVQTEMEARRAEIALLVDATGSASKLVSTDRAVLRKMRHADVDVDVLRGPGKTLAPAKSGSKNGSSKNAQRRNL